MSLLPVSNATLPNVPTRRSWVKHLSIVALLALLAVGLAGLALVEERARQNERTLLFTQNIARLLDAHLDAVFGQVDLLLRGVNDGAQHTLDDIDTNGPSSPRNHHGNDDATPERLTSAQRAALQAQLRDDLRRLAGPVPVDPTRTFAAAAGVDAASGAAAMPTPVPAPSPVPVQGRRDTLLPAELELTVVDVAEPSPSGHPGAAGLQVSGPQRAGNRWVLSFERPLTDRHGRHRARLLAHLPVDQLEQVFDGVNLGRHGAATLRSGNLALIWRQPWPAGAVVVGDQQVSAELRAAIAREPQSGHYTATTRVDNVERVNSYRRMGRQPFYLIVGVATESFPGGWGALDLGLLLAASLSLAAAVLSSLFIYRASRRQTDVVQRTYEAIVTSSFDAIISKSLDGRVRSWNPAAEAIFGHSAAEMIGQPLMRLIPPDRRHEEDQILERITKGETVDHFETVRQRKDGTQVAVSVTISPLRDARGRIVGASKIVRDITRQKAVESQMRDLAFNDPLTGLANRRLLFDRLHQAQAASRRSRQWAALIYIDLDRFKQINDHHGHAVGDKLLVELAGRLTQAVRGSDTVARMGGDEFVVLCPDLGSDARQADSSAQALLSKLHGVISQPCNIDHLPIECSASMGLQLFQGSDGDIDDLVRQADQAMYRAKLARV
jgi:diguanylate cyclase (GGDEF)-like protein/PAS domain S-box-containing protein